MANSGNSRDSTILRNCIFDGRCLKYNENDCFYDTLFKNIINKVVLSDVVTNHSWNGKTYYNHSAHFTSSKNAINKINQIRLKNWYFNPINNG